MAYEIYNLESVPDSTVELLNTECKSFFCSLTWYENILDTVFTHDKKSSQFVVYNQDDFIQMFIPLKLKVSSSGIKTYESLTNYYSPFFQLTHNGGGACLFGFFDAFRVNEHNWDTLTLNAMSKSDVVELETALKGTGLPNISFYCFANWYLKVNQRSFDEYFAGLSSRVRNTVIRKTKQFNRLEGTKLEIVHKGEGLEKGIKAFETVYAASWKGEETFPDFISGLMRMASKQGALRLGIAYINNVAVAAQLWIVADNTAYIYKLAYVEKYKKLSIGSILTATLMRYVIDTDKVNYVDYLSGDDAYKKEWMSHRRERWGIMIFNWRTITGCLKMINEYSRFYFKKLVRK